MKLENIKIPILMYHEILQGTLKRSDLPNKMTPRYFISDHLFEEQLKALAKSGYKTVFFDEVRELNPGGRYVIITFDDGLIGNAKIGLPLLKKYGFKAIFFVTVGSIGSPRFMDWNDLRELIDLGMSVQSHTVSHHHLPGLKEEEIRKELCESKRILEDKLKVKVTSLSFPHGSYNQSIVRIARESGYQVMCTSEIACNDNRSFQMDPVVPGRITVTSKMRIGKYMRLLDFDKKEILIEKMAKGTKNTVKRIIGVKSYGKLYRYIFNIEAP